MAKRSKNKPDKDICSHVYRRRRLIIPALPWKASAHSNITGLNRKNNGAGDRIDLIHYKEMAGVVEVDHSQ